MAIAEMSLENLTLDQLSVLRRQYAELRTELKVAFIDGKITADEYSARKQEVRTMQLVIVQLIEQKQAEGQKLVAQAEEVVGLVVKPDTISSAERFNE